MKQSRFQTIALGAALCIATAAAHANILDGGFEQPAVPNGGYTVFNSGQVIGNNACVAGQIGCWTVIGPGNVAVVSGSAVENNISYVAAAGAQWLDLTGDGSNTQSGVEQPFNTVPGRAYKLKFSVGAIGVPSRVRVLVDGQQLMIATNNMTAGTTFNWKHFTAAFVATNTVTTLDFINLDPATDNQNGLDKVSVAP